MHTPNHLINSTKVTKLPPSKPQQINVMSVVLRIQVENIGKKPTTLSFTQKGHLPALTTKYSHTHTSHHKRKTTPWIHSTVTNNCIGNCHKHNYPLKFAERTNNKHINHAVKQRDASSWVESINLVKIHRFSSLLKWMWSLRFAEQQVNNSS